MPTLAETLDRIRSTGNAKRAPELTAVMIRATEELQESGMVEHIPQVGDPAPLFARANLRGETVRLATLLQSGPAVISFFRGRW